MGGMSGKVLIRVIYMLTHLILGVIVFAYDPKTFPIGIHVKSELWPISELWPTLSRKGKIR